jgi:hypothetical protein
MVPDLTEFEQRRRRGQDSTILLKLIAAPTAFVPAIGQEAYDVATEVTRT